MTPDDFRQLLREKEAYEIVEELILSEDPGPNTTQDALDYLLAETRAMFSLDATQKLEAIVVGSAKLGFSFLEKFPRDGQGYKPAFRDYVTGVSDIDIAIVSQHLYGQLWKEIAHFGANQPKFPWKSALGDYMLHGWIRPDKFPLTTPQKCLDWKTLVQNVSRSHHFRYKKLRCAIYHSRYFLNLYQQRGVTIAQQAERVL